MIGLNPKLALKASLTDLSTAINGIEIGGRNILKQTKTLTTTYSSGSYTSASRETIEGFVETKITAQQSGYMKL